jgi:hypothetical protein
MSTTSHKLYVVYNNTIVFEGTIYVDDVTNNITAVYQSTDATQTNLLITTPTGLITYINNNYTTGSPAIYSYSTVPNAFDGGYGEYCYQLTSISNKPIGTTTQAVYKGWSADTFLGNYTITYYVDTTPNIACFAENSKILCLNDNLNEEYKLIQDLRRGTFVKTYKYGFRKIYAIGKGVMKNTPSKYEKCMYIIPKMTPMTEDLVVTGEHGILVDKLTVEEEKYTTKFYGGTSKIEDKFILTASIASICRNVRKVHDENNYTYYHFILENDGDDDKRYGVFANGLLTETPSKKQFIKHKFNLVE